MNSSECYRCHKIGHFARECPSSNGGRGGGGYRGGRCGGAGGGYRGAGGSYRGAGGSYRGAGGSYRGAGGCDRSSFSSCALCYKCGRSGHITGECRVEVKICYVCGKSGHISTHCDQQNEGDVSCYQCGKIGHMWHDCPSLGKSNREIRKCYSCGEFGHISRDCPEGGDSADVDDTVCYRPEKRILLIFKHSVLTLPLNLFVHDRRDRNSC